MRARQRHRVVLAAVALAWSTIGLVDNAIPTNDSPSPSTAFEGLQAPRGLHLVRNDVLPGNYPGLECVDVVRNNTAEKLGFICVVKNNNFAQEMGVSAYDTLPIDGRPTPRPPSGLVVATPMRQYAMQSFIPGTAGVVSALVDCDTQDGPIYRATASCHVAITAPGREPTLYSNFIAANHITRKRGIPLASIRMLWRQLLKH